MLKRQQKTSCSSTIMSSSNEEERETSSRLKSQWLRIASVVSLYWFISISMVFLNKYLLSGEDWKLAHTPIFVTWSQAVVASLCFLVAGLVSSRWPNTIPFPPADYNIVTIVKVVPLSVIFVGMIVFNNLTLKHLGVAFYTIARSLTTIFNVMFSFLILRQKISAKILICCGVIVCGFLFGTREEGETISGISVMGVVEGVLASMCVALFAIYVKKTLPLVEDDVFKLQVYYNLNASIMLLVVMVLAGELPYLLAYDYWNNFWFWSLLIGSGVLSIAIGFATSLQIKVTTPLSANISGTAKATAQTVLGCIVFSQYRSWWWWACNFMVLGGSFAYTYARMNEMKKESILPPTKDQVTAAADSDQSSA